MKITIIGTGYVGLVTGTCLAEINNDVTCVDNDENKIHQIENGDVPIYEPGLSPLLKRNIYEKRLHFTTDLKKGIENAEVIFLALPTPPDADGSADLSYVLQVASEIGPLISNYIVIVNKSTVPIGTAELVYKEIVKSAKTEFDVVSNPEFLKEGFAVNDFMKPDRVVVGADSEKAFKVMRQIYKPLTHQYNNLIETDTRSAEAIKYAANAFLATKISFANFMANLCEEYGANVDDVRRGMGADERIGKRFLYAGTGYGGSCFPKDVKALKHMAWDHNVPTELIEAVEIINERQKRILPTKIKNYYGDDLSGKTFALWGLSFKPDTDDIREAPSLVIINELLAAGAIVIAYDPEATSNVKKHLGKNSKVKFVDDSYKALKNVDGLVIATDWREFYNPDLAKMKKLMKHQLIFDGRNLFELKDMVGTGFRYESIGRKIIEK